MDPYIDIPQKKRGRKKKECSVLDSVSISNSINNNNNNNNDNDNDDNDDNDNNIMFVIESDPETPTLDIMPVVIPVIDSAASNKKRGRKPKGGKLVLKVIEQPSQSSQANNVILHLKCSLNELNEYNKTYNQQVSDPHSYNPEAPPEIKTYNDLIHANSFSAYASINTNTTTSDVDCNAYTQNMCNVCNTRNTNKDHTMIDESAEKKTDDIQLKDINAKLKKLKIDLYKNAVPDTKKSACFWCTCDFDNSPCYIPNYNSNGAIYGYGSFCRPECAVAYLMKENIDDSAKFDQYNLLNQIYSKIYDYKKNIKPAPNPYFLLDKFYGNLTIQEYRRLLKSEHMLLVIDKPLTRILPELHEDTDEFILNIYGGVKDGNTNGINNTNTNISTRQQQQQGGVYKVKRQSEKPVGPTKTSIIQSTFGK